MTTARRARDDVYAYDRQLYSRAFLNCYQRQALVMLAESVPDLELVFHACLVPTDDLLDQVVLRHVPRYDFECGFFSHDDFLAVGLVREEQDVDTYAEVRPMALETIAREGWTILVVDCFYLPHTPEYRVKHITHCVVLTGYDEAAGSWTIVDDNPAGVLCTYRYPDAVIASAYDNNVMRRMRSFRRTAPVGGADPVAALSGTAAALSDQRVLLTGIADAVADPWTAPERMYALLYDAFSLYQGSRTCLLAFAARAGVGAAAEEALGRIVAGATTVTNTLLLARATGALEIGPLAETGAQLAEAEAELVSTLASAPGGR